MKKKRFSLSWVIYHVLMALTCALMIYPFVWMFASSFKPNTDIFTTVESLIPVHFTIEHYPNGWRGFAGFSFGGFFRNSAFVAILSTVGAVFSSVVVAFGFGRLKFPGRGFWFGLMMLTMMLPSQVLMIPQFILFNALGMVGTFQPLILPHFFGGAFSIFMVMQFIRGIPREMDDAARIDGCGWYGVFGRIYLPMIRPAVATVAILTFMGSWQDFMGPLLYLNGPKQYTAAYALKLFNDSAMSDYGATFAMSILSLLPILMLFFLFQKQLVEGISLQGLKG